MNEFQQKRYIYQNFAAEVEHQLERILSEEKISCNAITSRVKDIESLSGKIDRKGGKYSCLEDLTDIAGVRVITYYSDDVDRVADIVEREFTVDRENSIDKREALEPDRFGDCSVHYVVGMSDKRLKLCEYKSFLGLKCEIQIRRNFLRLVGLLEIVDKEFYEIREFLLSYEKETSNTLELKTRGEDIEINAILLSQLTDKNKEVIEINTTIESITGVKMDNDISPGYYEANIRELFWFGIYTLDQLYDFIEKNYYYAIKIAEKIFMEKESDLENLVIRPTIAFFYLSYAELVANTEKYDFDSFVKYLNDFNIGDPDKSKTDIAHELFQLRKQLHSSG